MIKSQPLAGLELQLKPRKILGKMVLTLCLLLDKSNAIYEVWFCNIYYILYNIIYAH